MVSYEKQLSSEWCRIATCIKQLGNKIQGKYNECVLSCGIQSLMFYLVNVFVYFRRPISLEVS